MIVWQKFTGRARQAVAEAQDRAKQWGDPVIEPAHLLLAIANNPESVGAQLLVEMGVNLDELTEDLLRRMPPQIGLISAPVDLSPNAQKVVDLCYEEARKLKDEFVGTEHLLLGIVRLDDGPTGATLRHFKVSLVLARAAVSDLREAEKLPTPPMEHSGLLGRISDFFRRLLN